MLCEENRSVWAIHEGHGAKSVKFVRAEGCEHRADAALAEKD